MVARKSPEELLRQVEAEESSAGRGHLKIFLGYASGVGKSFRMLDEARRRRERGQDVVVGGVQPKAPPDVEALLPDLEVIPQNGDAIDVEAILRRRPAVCIIDGLAYDNPPGSRRSARWLDVEDLIAAGIKVIGSINIQYIAELRERVEPITGKRVTATVPLAFIQGADEIEVVDAPLGQFEPLREMALVLAADVVERQLSGYLDQHGVEYRPAAQERILICVTPRANLEQMLTTGRIIATRFHGELIVAYVQQPEISTADRKALEEKLATARRAGARVEVLDGEDAVEAILEFAHRSGITQLFIGHSQRSGLWARIRGSPVDRLIRAATGMDVRVFPQ